MQCVEIATQCVIFVLHSWSSSSVLVTMADKVTVILHWKCLKADEQENKFTGNVFHKCVNKWMNTFCFHASIFSSKKTWIGWWIEEYEYSWPWKQYFTKQSHYTFHLVAILEHSIIWATGKTPSAEEHHVIRLKALIVENYCFEGHKWTLSLNLKEYSIDLALRSNNIVGLMMGS